MCSLPLTESTSGSDFSAPDQCCRPLLASLSSVSPEVHYGQPDQYSDDPRIPSGTRCVLGALFGTISNQGCDQTKMRVNFRDHGKARAFIRTSRLDNQRRQSGDPFQWRPNAMLYKRCVAFLLPFRDDSSQHNHFQCLHCQRNHLY